MEMSMKYGLVGMVLLAACILGPSFAWPCVSRTEGAQAGKGKIMEQKLKQSQKLLEGIALSDFDKITKSAEELIQLTKTEEWQKFKTPRYLTYTAEFRDIAEGLIAKAKAKNIDGVTLAYFQMTVSCVHCHQYIREVRDARLDRPNVDIATILQDHERR
jgi:hypothetical protein